MTTHRPSSRQPGCTRSDSFDAARGVTVRGRRGLRRPVGRLEVACHELRHDDCLHGDLAQASGSRVAPIDALDQVVHLLELDVGLAAARRRPG